MTTAEKEKRILDFGSPWKDIMRGLEVHRHLTDAEKNSEHKGAIAKAREDYYSHALETVIECAHRDKKPK